MTPIIGARKTEKELMVVTKVGALLTTCQGCTIQLKLNVIMAPYGYN